MLGLRSNKIGCKERYNLNMNTLKKEQQLSASAYGRKQRSLDNA